MAQSLNTRAEFVGEGIAYIGFAKYGKIMLGDSAFEFFSDRSVEDNVIIPLDKIKRVEGSVYGKKIGRRFNIILQNNSKLCFGAKDSGKILKLLREKLGNENVVKAPTFLGTLSKAFKRNK